MHAGAYNDQIECMELLEQHEANVNAVDANGYTPLMIAAERGHVGAIGMLFSILLLCIQILIPITKKKTYRQCLNTIASYFFVSMHDYSTELFGG